MQKKKQIISYPFSYLCGVEKFCQHIEKLLAQHDYVVIPHLGGFVVQAQSAVILHDRITAPFSTIAFNPLMHHTDGLLAIEIARSKQISYRMAVEYINKEVEILHSKLNSGNVIRFGNLGLFFTNEDGLLIFKPAHQTDFLPGNFLLSDLYTTIKNNESIQEKTLVNISLPLPSVHTFKYVAAAMLVFGLFLSTPKVNNSRQSTANIASFGLPRKATTTTNTATTINTATPVKREQSNKKISNEQPKICEKFHIIIATLSNKKAADEFCKELPEKRYSDISILSTNNVHRVAIASFDSKSKALEHMEQLRKSDPLCKTAWVLCNTSK